MDDPINDIENERNQIDLGVMAARVYAGALQESGSLISAYLITSAYFSGMFHPNLTSDDES